MSHPDPLYDSDNSYEDDDMSIEHDPSDALLVEYLYGDHDDFYGESADYSDYNDDRDYDDENSGEVDWDDSYDDSMDGDAESALSSAGWGTDEDYGYYGDDTPMYDDYYGGE